MATLQGIIPYFTGRHITVASITPQTLNAATGLFTDGTATNLANLASTTQSVVDSVMWNFIIENEEISAANAGVRNHVPIKIDFDVEVREIVQANGGSACLQTSFSYSYFKLISTVTDGVSPVTITAYCVITSCEIEYGEGKSVAVLRGTSVGLNPIVS